MDISLVLTHRCNFACHYCYAAPHGRIANAGPTDMDATTAERGVALLFADGAQEAQLSFFGGEPFLALDQMAYAIELGEREARRRGARLTFQCTTNGSRLDARSLALVARTKMKLVVSIDGIREVHDAQRPLAGGGPSFDLALAGLRAAVQAKVDVEALVVITPASVARLAESVAMLWDEGVSLVRGNLELGASWGEEQRHALGEELVKLGREQLRRALRGEASSFQPFALGLEAAARGSEGAGAPCTGAHEHDHGRRQLVVATGGNLYPCGPMVGRDRDDGPEAALRLGHLDEGPQAIIAAVDSQGAGCGEGVDCACAAYLETGDRRVGGPNGIWFGKTCFAVGQAIGGGLAEHAQPEPQVAQRPRRPRRSRTILYVGAGIGAVGLGAAAFIHTTIQNISGEMRPPKGWKPPKGIEAHRGGAVAIPPPVPPRPSIDGEMAPPKVQVPGQMAAPAKPKPKPRPAKKVRRTLVKGDIAAPPRPRGKPAEGAPPTPLGVLRAPPPAAPDGKTGE